MQGKYSKYIRPLVILGDLLILVFNGLLVFYVWARVKQGVETAYDPFFGIYLLISWPLLGYILRSYEIFRFSRTAKVVRKAITHGVLFALMIWAYIGVSRWFWASNWFIFLFSVLHTFSIILFRLTTIFALRRYRIRGGNHRKVIVAGTSENANALIQFFKKNPEYGYEFLGKFDDDKAALDRVGDLEDIREFVVNNPVEEVYFCEEVLSPDIMRELIDYCENNLVVPKFVPLANGMQHQKLKIQYYGVQPVYALRELPFEDPMNKFFKRSFDVLFSLLVILGLLWWFVPLMAILIKRESRGPVFFKQRRSGLNNEEFWVYKFRSMAVNEQSDELQATKNDMRVTKLGAFMRRTSIDELPQFLNVFGGSMSVVGPRPHMLKHTEEYRRLVDRYMVRHFVKPGITGLAQVRGHRGETETLAQMRNRVRMDIFYLENWSMVLDIKIILQTVLNGIKGEENAY